MAKKKDGLTKPQQRRVVSDLLTQAKKQLLAGSDKWPDDWGVEELKGLVQLRVKSETPDVDVRRKKWQDVKQVALRSKA